MHVPRRARFIPLVVSVTGSMVAAVASLWVMRHLASIEWFQANHDVAGNYLQTIGTIDAVLLAFVVFVVWQQHNEARHAVETEANELGDLHRIVQNFGANDGDDMTSLTRAYQAAVVEEEWTLMISPSC